MSDPACLGAALRLTGAVSVPVVAVVIGWAYWADSGPFVLVLGGVPTAAVVPVLVGTLRRRRTLAATWVAAAVVLGWALLTGRGAGFWFAGPGVVLVLAAAVTTATRTPPGRPSRPDHAGAVGSATGPPGR